MTSTMLYKVCTGLIWAMCLYNSLYMKKLYCKMQVEV